MLRSPKSEQKIKDMRAGGLPKRVHFAANRLSTMMFDRSTIGDVSCTPSHDFSNILGLVQIGFKVLQSCRSFIRFRWMSHTTRNGLEFFICQFVSLVHQISLDVSHNSKSFWFCHFSSRVARSSDFVGRLTRFDHFGFVDF